MRCCACASCAAVAALRVERDTGETFGVETDERERAILRAKRQREMGFGAEHMRKSANPKHPAGRRQRCLGDRTNLRFGAIGDPIGDRRQFQTAQRGKRLPFGQVRHREPSALIISQSTVAGHRPTSRVRSSEASVWPGRVTSPLVAACSGKTRLGRVRSSGRFAGSISARMAVVRSNAEMPVVAP